MVTRDDVARLAGTSTAVVSYVLNDGPRPVAAATRARVLAAVAKLGYRPNGVARSLRAKRTRVLGLLVPDSSNPYFARLARAVEDAAFASGHAVVLGNAVDDVERELAYVRTFLESRVDGLLYIPAASTSPSIEELARSKVPTVVLDRTVAGLSASSVTADNRVGARMATRHLLQHGHRRIAYLGGPAHLSTARDRRRGWADAMRGAGLSVERPLSVAGAFDRETGYHGALALLTRDPAPTAVFAAADELGLGAMRAAFELGWKVPDDVAIISFDGVAEAAAYTVPSLSCVRQPVETMGRRAIEMLLDLIAGTQRTHRAEVVPVDLVARGTCGCPEKPASAHRHEPTPSARPEPSARPDPAGRLNQQEASDA
ncbi:LacI family DNA-binding transcriptional regulator [Actinopolymorpha pittospori]